MTPTFFCQQFQRRRCRRLLGGLTRPSATSSPSSKILEFGKNELNKIKSRRCLSSYSTTSTPSSPKVYASSASTTTDSSDYIVIGAGSAGCVIASRLVQAGHTVTLLEAGQSDVLTNDPIRNLFIHLPTALAYPMSFEKTNWKFQIEPESALGGRVVSCPRGKGLGGSSSINGMVFVRGHPEDYNAWQNTFGATNWSYEHVLPYFRKMENWQQYDENSKYRGNDGPLHVKFGDNAAKTPLYDLFIEAGEQAGYGVTDDYNGYRQEGFSQMPMTVFHSGSNKGMRCSTSSAYLHPTLQEYGPDRLQIQTGAITQKLLFDTNDDNNVKQSQKEQPCCVGVAYSTDDGSTTKHMYAKKEVIVCTGSIQSPQLLQVSGIGDRENLEEEIGVQCLVHNPNVGQNLQDHLELYFQQEVLQPISIAPILSSYFEKLRLGIQWILTRQGMGATNHFEASAFVRSSPSEAYPDIQFHFLPVGISYDGVTLAQTKSGHSMQIHVGTCRSPSRGYVKAVNSSMSVSPRIKFNYMSCEEDWVTMRQAIEVARQVMRQPVMEDIAGEEILPGPEYEDDLDGYIRDHVESAYHPCGTCKMGSDSKTSVVDPEGKVYGVQSLRVADASIFPQITNGNLNGPVIMVAERISDMILGQTLQPIANEDNVDEEESLLWWKPPPNDMDREKKPLVG